MGNQGVLSLFKTLQKYEQKYNEAVLAIDIYLDFEFLYKDIECHAINYDFDLDYICICAIDGESTLSSSGKYLNLTFEEFDKQCIKL